MYAMSALPIKMKQQLNSWVGQILIVQILSKIQRMLIDFRPMQRCHEEAC